MPSSPTPTSTSVSTSPSIPKTVADSETFSATADAPRPVFSDVMSADGIPMGVGARKPIPIVSPVSSSASANGQHSANGAHSTSAPTSKSAPFIKVDEQGNASVTTPSGTTATLNRDGTVSLETAESVEHKVARLRPRSLTMQARFLYTLVFAFWLFGRLIFWQIYVAKYFSAYVNRTNGRRWQTYAREFRQFAIRMGGVQIKAGQFASTRADILPEAVIAELAGLQDKVPTISYEQVRAVLERELGDKLKEYAWVNHEPIAAASLGQVHRAQLMTGERVVVKIQRPNVRPIVYTDMTALFIVARVAMRFSFVRRRADAVQIVEEFGRVLLEEVSYHQEADNALRFARMYEADTGVYVPRIYPALCTDQVMTIEDVTNIKLDDYEALLAAGVDRKAVASRLMDTYMKQIFEERFFHADPHPGNLFVRPLPVEDERLYRDGVVGRPFQLIFIDFGMTSSLTPEIRQGLINTLAAVITRDAHKLILSYQELGFLLPDADVRRLEEATRAVFDQVWGLSMTDMTSMDFEVVANIGREFSDLIREMPFRVPQDFVYLGRTVSILSGMATALDPQFNPWTTIQERVQTLITTDENNLWDELLKTVREPFEAFQRGGTPALVASLQSLFKRFQRTSKAERLLEQLLSGDLQIETKLSQQHRRQLERIEAQGKRSTRAFLFGSLLITATLLYTNGDAQAAMLFYMGAGGAGMAWFLTKD